MVVYDRIYSRTIGAGNMSKLNQVLLDWNAGDVHGLRWFEEREIGQRQAFSYFEGGYLEKIGPGVFKRKGDKINPYGLIRFMQDELNLKFHLAGRSALETHGHSHYLSLGDIKLLYLLSYEIKSVPKWLFDLDEGFKLIFNKSSLLREESFITEVEVDGFTVKSSCRELAILEFIENLNLSNGLETAQNYTESLLTLREDVLQNVLEQCRSVKVKRVFLYLAETANLPSFKGLILSKVDLGKGKRVVVVGGELNKKYQITVDRTYEENPF